MLSHKVLRVVGVGALLDVMLKISEYTLEHIYRNGFNFTECFIDVLDDAKLALIDIFHSIDPTGKYLAG
jgi:hypothetical protein